MNLKELLQRIDSLKKEVDQLRPLNPERQKKILDKLRFEWTYNSNAIEGNVLSLGETKVVLLEGLTSEGTPLKDHLDILGHCNVIDFLVRFVKQDEPLTEAAIREMHKIFRSEEP